MNFDPAWLAPPLVGAFIGYMTNYVAIRMLFRPLKPWRIFGLRVPMTPGVIPARRHDLAKNIGRMVGSHLLTSDDVGRAVSGERFQKELAAIIDARARDLLGRDLGPPAALIPRRFAASFTAGVKILRWRTLRLIHNYLDSDAFAAGLAATLDEHLAPLFAKAPAALLPDTVKGHFSGHAAALLQGLLAGGEVEDFIRTTVRTRLETILTEESSLESLLPAPVVSFALDLVEAEAPALVDQAAAMLAEEETRERLVVGIRAAIGRFIEGLGPMAALAAGFLTPELIEEKVREILEEKGDEIAAWLANDEVRKRVGILLRDKASALLARPVSELLAGLDEDSRGQLMDQAAGAVVAMVRAPETAAAAGRLLEEAIDKQADRPLGELLADFFGAGCAERSREAMTREIITLVRSRRAKRLIDRALGRLLDRYLLERPIGPLADFLPKNVVNGISGYTRQVLTRLLAKEVPPLVDSLNIERIVTRKVDSLDLLRLEDLLLSIMREQFTYINLFGGILGFLIGLANLLFLG